MAYAGLNWQVMSLPFRAGLNQKADDRARPQPFLDICRDAQFDELGGLQTRFPFAAMSNAIFGGGTLANCRRLAVVNDELCVFTDVALYSWNAQLAKWVLRGTHLGVAVDEQQRFVTTGDQVDGDRAELNGTIVYAWTEGAGTATSVYAAAMDKASGSVLVGPTAISPAGTFAGRARLVALATKILLFTDDGAGNLKVRAIDPADPATGFASVATTVLGVVFLGKYDVVRVDGADQAVGACNRNPTTSYTVFTVTAALAVATSTKARTADGPLAVATITGGAQTQLVRGNGTNVQGDLLTTSTLADVFVNQAIGTVVGTPINQIAVAFAGATATVFWDSLETTGSGNASFSTKVNTVTTANVVGAQAVLVLRLGIASRAFTRAGSVFVWLVFAEQSANTGTGIGLGIRGQLQNTYLLYRADGHITAKSVFQVAGGYSPSAGHLPGVATTSGTGDDLAWLGAFRRKIALGGADHTGYSSRSPIDITFSFDSNAARRSVRLGATMYITGGILLQYDGTGLFEVGFFNYPWAFATQDSGVAGNVAAGTYSWKSTWKWTNGRGEVERSTTATGEQLTLALAHFVIISIFFLLVTRKVAPRSVTVEIWRTAANTDQGSPYYLATGQDPGVITGDNCFIPNDTTQTGLVWNDNFADATLISKEQNPQNDGTLESLAPPAAKIAIATDTRIYLAGVAGDPDAIWYSRLRKEGEIASFHDGNRAFVPRDGGAITGLVIHNETLTAFRSTAIYRLPGGGFNNLGQGQNFEAFMVASDVGAVSHEAVATIPLGTIFKSRKGWYLLTPGWSTQYIGDKVADYDSETVLAVDVVETQHQVRILTSGRMLVWDYYAVTAESPIGQWGEWTIADGIDSLIWNGTHVYLTATGPKQQQATYAGVTYGMDVETADIKLSDLQGASRCRKVQPFGELRSDCLVRTRIAYNYKRTAGVPDYVDDKAWTPSPAVIGGPLQFKHGPKRPMCESIKVRFTACASTVLATRATATFAVPVQTSGTNWAATFQAVAPGELGNALTLRLAFVVGAGSIDVRDHFAYDPVTATWSPAVGTIGVLVTGAPTVAQLEAAIVAGTTLATLTIADPTPGKVVNVAAMAALAVVTGAFTAGAFGPPAGEAIKLTALGLEVGTEPGLYNRLPAAQRQ